MDAQLVIHFDIANGQEVWWAESPDVPGFTASAETLLELRAGIAAVLGDISKDVGEEVRFGTEVLADVATGLPEPVLVESDQAPDSVGQPTPRVKVLSLTP
jgi:hypothetical protein